MRVTGAVEIRKGATARIRVISFKRKNAFVDNPEELRDIFLPEGLVFAPTLPEKFEIGAVIEFKDLSKTQGVLTARYEFFENKSQKHSGIFIGELKTKWYLDKNNQIQYDDINAHSDGFFNNAFVGSWKTYNSNLNKKCNWGDYRVPNIDCDFDLGAGEFSVSKKYWNKGWLDIALKNKMPNGIIETKTGKTKMEWWQ